MRSRRRAEPGLEAGVRARACPLDAGRGARAGRASPRTSSTRALDWLERATGADRASARRAATCGAGELGALRPLLLVSSRGAAARWRRSGYSRDGRRGTLQIVYGLALRRAGRSAVEVFDGGQRTTTRPSAPARQAQAALRARRARPGRRSRHGHARQPRRDPRSRRASTGSPRCRRRSCSGSPAPGRFRRRCLTSKTWPRSQARSSPVSASSSAATRSSPPSAATASARRCWRRPRPTSPRSRERVERGTLHRARPRSASPSAR